MAKILIADELSRALHLPMQARWLRKIRSGTPQQHLDAETRHKNLRDAFACKRDVTGLHVAVIDDVVTAAAHTLCRGRAGRFSLDMGGESGRQSLVRVYFVHHHDDHNPGGRRPIDQDQ